MLFQDEKNQVLTTNVWFDQEWQDELLKWDPKDFGGIEKLLIPCDKLWLPDIVLYNRWHIAFFVKIMGTTIYNSIYFKKYSFLFLYFGHFDILSRQILLQFQR